MKTIKHCLEARHGKIKKMINAIIVTCSFDNSCFFVPIILDYNWYTFVICSASPFTDYSCRIACVVSGLSVVFTFAKFTVAISS